MRPTKFTLVCALLGLCLTGSGIAQCLNGFDLQGVLVPIDAIARGRPPRDGIPAIDSPRFVSAAQAGLGDKDRVLGLAREGVVRAYPVRILNWHEVVNERIGGERVAITYCPLCGTGVAFSARVAGEPLPGVMAFWFAWVAFNPQKTVLAAPASSR